MGGFTCVYGLFQRVGIALDIGDDAVFHLEGEAYSARALALFSSRTAFGCGFRRFLPAVYGKQAEGGRVGGVVLAALAPMLKLGLRQVVAHPAALVLYGGGQVAVRLQQGGIRLAQLHTPGGGELGRVQVIAFGKAEPEGARQGVVDIQQLLALLVDVKSSHASLPVTTAPSPPRAHAPVVASRLTAASRAMNTVCRLARAPACAAAGRRTAPGPWPRLGVGPGGEIARGVVGAAGGAKGGAAAPWA